MPPPVFRFAPSPNGYLHLGHALSALINARMARTAGGRLLLRIDDIDATRCRPEYETAIYQDLGWLGLTWEEPVWRESEHNEDYRAALATLEAQGLVYPSFESRAEIAMMVAGRDARGHWPRDPDGAPLYPGNAKTLSASERRRRIDAGEPYALRLDMMAAISSLASIAPPLKRQGRSRQMGVSNSNTRLATPLPQGERKGSVGREFSLTWSETGAGPNGETGIVQANPAAWGDVILARKDAPASYHLAVVVDDAAQGITDVVRGSDLFHATGVHRLLQALLGLIEPRYCHHRLILDADGRKLSKSTAATGLHELRAAGATPADIGHRVGLD